MALRIFQHIARLRGLYANLFPNQSVTFITKKTSLAGHCKMTSTCLHAVRTISSSIVDEVPEFGEAIANAHLMAASPELLEACICALADLEGIMPEHEPSGDRKHPAWETIRELQNAINKAKGE